MSKRSLAYSNYKVFRSLILVKKLNGISYVYTSKQKKRPHLAASEKRLLIKKDFMPKRLRTLNSISVVY